MAEREYHDVFEERRAASRFGRERESDLAAIWLNPHEELVASVHDESLGGISLVVSDCSRLPVGCTVGLAYAGAFLQATVKHVRPTDDGLYVVGFETADLSV